MPEPISHAEMIAAVKREPHYCTCIDAYTYDKVCSRCPFDSRRFQPRLPPSPETP